MSNALAIAAVTAALRKIIQDGIQSELPDAKVTTKPPDKAEAAANLINLFLYQTNESAAWRNMAMPRQSKPGETGQPALALDLYYLITAYGKSDESPNPPESHRLLGRAMSVIYDHSVLSSKDIKDALPVADQPLYDLYDQIEHVRITHQPLNLDEMSKLWSACQAKYRISAAYLASVVLIESNHPSQTPLPVLKRGPQDQGVDAQANLQSPFPTLIAINPPVEQQPSARLGDQLTFKGHHLDGDSLTVRFLNQRLTQPIDIGPLAAPTSSEAAEVVVTLPDDVASRTEWVAGNYTASIVVTRASDPVNKERTTNELSFALAPKIIGGLPLSVAAADGDFSVALTCSPEVRPSQRASMLFRDKEILANTHSTQTGTLMFPVNGVTQDSVGEYFVRLRVDGVDSLLIRYDQTPPIFDDNQKVTIT